MCVYLSSKYLSIILSHKDMLRKRVLLTTISPCYSLSVLLPLTVKSICGRRHCMFVLYFTLLGYESHNQGAFC